MQYVELALGNGIAAIGRRHDFGTANEPHDNGAFSLLVQRLDEIGEKTLGQRVGLLKAGDRGKLGFGRDGGSCRSKRRGKGKGGNCAKFDRRNHGALLIPERLPADTPQGSSAMRASGNVKENLPPVPVCFTGLASKWEDAKRPTIGLRKYIFGIHSRPVLRPGAKPVAAAADCRDKTHPLCIAGV